MHMTAYFVGTSGWRYDRWSEQFFPGLPGGGPPRHFSAVEVNTAYHNPLCEPADMRWRASSLPGPRYAFKLPTAAIHQKQPATAQAELGVFWRAVCRLEERLGMVLLQLPPDLPLDLGWLQSVLSAFGDPSRVAVESLAPDWQGEDVRRQLAVSGAAWVGIDSPHHQLTEWVTGPRAYLRLHGRRRWFADEYTPNELEEIGRLAQRMARRGAQEIYIFFNNDISGSAQANALALIQLLR